MTREPIFAALFAKLAARPEFKTTARRLKHWDDVPANQQPALFMQQGAELAVQVPRQPSKRTLAANLIVYFRSDGGQVPGSVINPLLDAIDAALAPDNPITHLCTLGGLVDAVRVEGSIDIDEGTLDNQGVLHIPLHLITTTG